MQRILLLLTLLVGLCLPVRAQAPYELLWEVRHPSQARPSYLFGTMHVSDNRVFNLPDSVILAIQNTDGMAFELDFDTASYYTLEYLMRGDEFSLDDFDNLAYRLNPQMRDEFNLNKLLKEMKIDTEEDEEEEDAIPQEDPAVLGAENSVLFLDAFLFRVGRDLGKQRCGLEKVHEQFKLLYGGDGERSVLAEAKSSIRSGDLTKAYLAGNLRKIATWLEEDKMFDPRSRKLLLDDRNIGMVRGADSLMRLRPTFVAVGAAHLPGKAGVITLLRERGYTLRPVLATQRTGMARAIKNTPYSPNWQDFRNESAGYALRVPCRPYKANFTDLPVPMYVGMDFPGGWVYYFFAFSTDMAAGRDQEALRKNLISSLLESMEVEGTPYPVQSGGLTGEEAIVQHKDQSLRIRAVSNDKMVFVIFAGIDEEIVRSPMLDTMFNSLVTFPALPLSQRVWTTRIDSIGGFSIPMPAEVSRICEGPTEPESDPNFYKVFFSADDEQTREEFFLTYALVESQVLSEYDPLSMLVDSISYKYDYATIRDERDFNVDGFRAHEFILDLDGINTGIYRCVQRGDRLYMYGGTYTDQPGSKTRILSALDAFRFLPSDPSPLKYKLSTPTFTAKFPAPALPYHNESDEAAFWSTYGADSTRTWSTVDPRTGAYYFMSKIDYPAWTSLDSLTELMDAFNSPNEDRKDTYTRAITMPGAIAASERLSQTLDQRSSLYTRLWMHGQSLYWLYCTIEDGDETHVRAFADGIQLLPVPAFDWTSSKIALIIQQLQSTDEDEVSTATNALYNHRMDASVRQPLLDYLGQLAVKQEAPDHAFTVVDAIALAPSAGDPAAYRDLVMRFGFAPDMQAHLIGAMFFKDTLGLPQAAIQLLEEVRPRPDSYTLEDMVVRIEYHLQESQDAIARYDALAFMLDEPAYQAEFLYLTETMGGIGELEARHTGVFRARFQALAEEWIQTPQYDPLNGGLSFGYDYLISSLQLADPDARSYALLERIMDMGDPRVEEYAVLMLLDADRPLPKSRLIHLLEQPGYSAALLEWLWFNDQQKRVPKKYWKGDRLALAILQSRLTYGSSEGPSQVELLDKVPLVWDEKDQFLYVYRVGWEDREDWEVAFSGPFQQDGKIENFDFELTGSDSKMWTPQRQQELIDDWIEAAEDYQNWDE